MYLVAQRVRSRNGVEGVNTHIYFHGRLEWRAWPPFLPEDNPGTLYAQQVEVREEGLVRSFLDIVSPDSVGQQELLLAFTTLLNRIRQSIPYGVAIGRCWFRFNLEDQLRARWNEEIRELFDRAIVLFRSA